MQPLESVPLSLSLSFSLPNKHIHGRVSIMRTLCEDERLRRARQHSFAFIGGGGAPYQAHGAAGDAERPALRRIRPLLLLLLHARGVVRRAVECARRDSHGRHPRPRVIVPAHAHERRSDAMWPASGGRRGLAKKGVREKKRIQGVVETPLQERGRCDPRHRVEYDIDCSPRYATLDHERSLPMRLENRTEVWESSRCTSTFIVMIMR